MTCCPCSYPLRSLDVRVICAFSQLRDVVWSDESFSRLRGDRSFLIPADAMRHLAQSNRLVSSTLLFNAFLIVLQCFLVRSQSIHETPIQPVTARRHRQGPREESWSLASWALPTLRRTLHSVEPCLKISGVDQGDGRVYCAQLRIPHGAWAYFFVDPGHRRTLPGWLVNTTRQCCAAQSSFNML